jgi:hypothetical protein
VAPAQGYPGAVAERRLTPDERRELRALIATKQRIEERRRREARPRPRSRADGVLISPTGMAHKPHPTEPDRPACIHYEAEMGIGHWERRDIDWDTVPARTPKCRPCAGL